MDPIIDTLNVELTQVGAWINVVGYVKHLEQTSKAPASHASKDAPLWAASSIDAIAVWSAGAIKLDEYEAAVKSLQAL